MRVKIISRTDASDAEYLIQKALNEAAEKGEVMKEIHYSTAPAIIGDPPDERACCWHSALILFEAGVRDEN